MTNSASLTACNTPRIYEYDEAIAMHHDEYDGPIAKHNDEYDGTIAIHPVHPLPNTHKCEEGEECGVEAPLGNLNRSVRTRT